MAVTYKGKHHRNPSGRNNKVNWLLSQAKWNECELRRVYKQVIHENPGKHWHVVYALAVLQINNAIHKDVALYDELCNFVKRHPGLPHYVLDNITSLQYYMKQTDYRGVLYGKD